MAVEQQLFSDAVTLMGLGLGTVFVFLTLLVGVTSLMSSLVNRIVPVRVQVNPVPAAGDTVDDQLLAVITAAIHAHRNRR